MRCDAIRSPVSPDTRQKWSDASKGDTVERNRIGYRKTDDSNAATSVSDSSLANELAPLLQRGRWMDKRVLRKN